MLSSTVSTKGQVTIPVYLRKKLGLKPSDRVAFSQKENAILLKKTPNLDELYGLMENKKIKALSVKEMEKLSEKMFEISQ